jgi:hypothetical protein
MYPPWRSYYPVATAEEVSYKLFGGSLADTAGNSDNRNSRTAPRMGCQLSEKWNNINH